MKQFDLVIFILMIFGRECFSSEVYYQITELDSYISELNQYSDEFTENNQTIFFQESTVNNTFSTYKENYSYENIKGSQQLNNSQDSVVIKLANNRLIIENLPKNDILEIYNIMGVKVYNRRINAGTNEYILSLPKGYYILKIGKITKKIAIR